MKKRHRDRHPSPPLAAPALSIEAQRARVEALIASGETREAVEAAKQVLKETRSHEAEGLVVSAYEARIAALSARGMHDEARALGAVVRERFPAHRARLDAFTRQSAVGFAGNIPALLAELATAVAPRRGEMEAILARELTDPRVLAESAVLPEDDPLKRAARDVCDLFTAVTSGPLADGALDRLAGIPRRSPLAPWRLLIRAVDAFYRRQDAAVLANLSAIPLDSAPGRLVPMFRRLVGAGEMPDDRSLSVAAVLDQVSGGRARFEKRLAGLGQALAAKDPNRALTALQDVLDATAQAPMPLRRVTVATVLLHWLRVGLDPAPLTQALLRDRRDPDTVRLLAEALGRAGLWDDALVTWDRFLNRAVDSRRAPLSGPEVCRVLLHMADLFPADHEELLRVLEAGSEEELRRLIRTGALPPCFDRARLLERALEADPGPHVYRALVAHFAARDPRRAEAEARAWRRAHPEDLEPVLHLMRAAERRGAERKALGFLAEAEAINRVHPDVRGSRFRLLLASAERRIRARKLAAAAADLDQVEREPRAGEGDHMAYLVALRWAVARAEGGGEAAARLEQALAARTGNPVLLDLLLRSIGAAFGLDPGRPVRAHSQPETIEGLARAFDLFQSLERPLAVRAELFGRLEKGVAGAPLVRLHSLCACGLALGRPSLTYVAAGRGLAEDGAHLCRFLLARGRALAAAWRRQDRLRGRSCLRAARELAGRARDMEAVREASEALDALPLGAGPGGFFPDDPFLADDLVSVGAAPGQDEIMRTVAAERRRLDIPQFASPTAQRAPRRRSPRRHRHVLDELIGLLEGGG